MPRTTPERIKTDRAILRAIAAGHDTSEDLAAVLGIPKERMSVRLNRLRDDKKLIESKPSEDRIMGRPYLRWRLKDQSGVVR